MRPRLIGQVLHRIMTLALIVSIFGVGVGSARASGPPANDTFAAATVVTTLPFNDSLDTTLATLDPGEPQYCTSTAQTVWYTLTPATSGAIRIDPSASSFSDTLLTVYRATAPGFGGLRLLSCQTFRQSITFSAEAGATYYIQAGSIYGPGGQLDMQIQLLTPPPNDDFANAMVIGALPFNDTQDNAAASLQPGEPQPSCSSPLKTIWYAYTPTTSGSISARGSATFPMTLAVYTGSALSNMTEVGCRSYSGQLTFHALAGTTYYFQFSSLYDYIGPLQLHLQIAPAPIARFYFIPFTPSIFDTIDFWDYSQDPGDAPFQSRVWDFGDGTTGTGCCQRHRYTADGDYTVTLTITTTDGRTATTTQIVHVQTHDVAIVSLAAPQAARAGQTRQLTVDLTNKRYPETVTVQLLKGTTEDYQVIGTLMQEVPVHSGNRTTRFSFSYTFTNGDASTGKVTFKAIATIADTRDALPADNEAVAPPTKVSK